MCVGILRVCSMLYDHRRIDVVNRSESFFLTKGLVIFLLENIMGEHSCEMFGGSKNVLMRSSDPRG